MYAVQHAVVCRTSVCRSSQVSSLTAVPSSLASVLSPPPPCSQDTMLVGADFYETDAERAALLAAGKVPVGIGKNSTVK